MPIGKRFQPGQSGNPRGRPKGIARAVRDAVDLEEMIALLVDTARTASRDADRISAVRELLDRGYGKAPAFAAIEGLDPLELDEVSAEIQAITNELLQRRLVKEATEPAATVGAS